MKKVILPLAVVALTFFGITKLNAQADTNAGAHSLTVSIPEVALLDIEGGTSVTLTPTAPTEAGNPIDFSTATNSSLWLNYSSIIGDAPDDVRIVQVAATGTLPTGSNLIVTAGAPTSDGAGTKGSSSGAVTIAAVATNYTVLGGIGSCYTGNGSSKGSQLSYSMTENSGSYGSFNFNTDYTVTLTYTLSDN